MKDGCVPNGVSHLGHADGNGSTGADGRVPSMSLRCALAGQVFRVSAAYSPAAPESLTCRKTMGRICNVDDLTSPRKPDGWRDRCGRTLRTPGTR